MPFILQEPLRFKSFSYESVVYKIETAETLLLERRAANILQAIPCNPITYSQLEACVASGIGSDPDCLSLEEVLSHLVAAGLVKKVA